MEELRDENACYIVPQALRSIAGKRVRRAWHFSIHNVIMFEGGTCCFQERDGSYTLEVFQDHEGATRDLSALEQENGRVPDLDALTGAVFEGIDPSLAAVFSWWERIYGLRAIPDGLELLIGKREYTDHPSARVQ